MGLIKMFTSAVGSTFADQVVEYFRCEDMSTKILCQPATLVKRGKTVNNGTEGVISNGSRFDVAVNQAALLIENGRVHDCVARTVNVCIVTCLGLILDMRGVDSDTAFLFLGCVVDGVERTDFRKSFFSQYLGDGCCQSGFTVVNVADSTDVDMRLVPFESFFCHNV